MTRNIRWARKLIHNMFENNMTDEKITQILSIFLQSRFTDFETKDYLKNFLKRM